MGVAEKLRFQRLVRTAQSDRDEIIEEGMKIDKSRACIFVANVEVQRGYKKTVRS